jgi:sec-independent protein translocase protein TatB
MLSIPHMIVVFLVVLVVFGPQKLPELARTFGKLMAEFRKASTEFKSAFEDEIRDLERQAHIAELRKQAAEAVTAADAATRSISNPSTPAPPSAAPVLPEAASGSQPAESRVVSPVAEAVPRLDGENVETEAKAAAEPATETPPSHDHQQPA